MARTVSRCRRRCNRLTLRGHRYRIYTSVSDKESQKQSTSNHGACSTQWTLSRLAGLSQAGTTYVRAQSRLPLQRWFGEVFVLGPEEIAVPFCCK
jgi:hypothetical protein